LVQIQPGVPFTGEKMTSQQYNDFRLQELITRREAMLTANKQREQEKKSLVYTEKEFMDLANEIRLFAETM
jgi:hypothetical protein